MSAPYFLSSDPGPVIRLKLNDWVNIIADASKPTTLSTSITVGTGQKTITVPADRAFGPGQSIRIARTSNPANVWMQGTVVSYSGTSLIVQVSSASGSGTYSDWTITLSGGIGPAGDDGWAPVFALAADGERRVLRITDWTGGTGTKPPTGYVSASGITSNIALAVDVRGPQGAKGDTGPANTLSIGTVQSGASANATITGTAPNQTLNLTLPKGDAGEDGTDGWTPVFAVVADGDRRVWEIIDWTGGTGTKPATGYLGAGGIVADIADALDVRGPEGAKGDKGDKGDTGDIGPAGDDGWTPVFAVVADGERRVMEILDWTGGIGTKPATGYLGAAGIVADIADALDVRGAPGSGSVSTVNNKDPDGSGNVDLGISDIPGLEDALDNAGKVKTVAGKGPDGSGNVALDKGDLGLGNVDNVSAADLRDRSTHTGTQPASTITGLAAVATSGSYNDLDDKPTIPQAPVNADWNASSGLAQILNKPELGDLAAKNSVGVADIDATGTPSSATYLRGDGTWETPAGGGSGTPATVEELRALTGNNTVTPSVIALAHANAGILSGTGTINFDWRNLITDTVTLTGNRQLANPTNVIPGTTRTITVKGNSTAYRTLSFGDNYQGALPDVRVSDEYFVTLHLYAVSADEILVSAVEWPEKPVLTVTMGEKNSSAIFIRPGSPQEDAQGPAPGSAVSGELGGGYIVDVIYNSSSQGYEMMVRGDHTVSYPSHIVVGGVACPVIYADRYDIPGHEYTIWVISETPYALEALETYTFELP